MTGAVFVDTNVLVYARDTSEAAKHKAAVAWMEYLWNSRKGRLSIQVLQEYYVTVTRKMKPGLRKEEARNDVRALRVWQPLELDGVVLEGAWVAEDRFSLSWWDALIVSAAQVLGCRVLLSEDLAAGQDLNGVMVVNPFEVTPAELPARSP